MTPLFLTQEVLNRTQEEVYILDDDIEPHPQPFGLVKPAKTTKYRLLEAALNEM